MSSLLARVVADAAAVAARRLQPSSSSSSMRQVVLRTRAVHTSSSNTSTPGAARLSPLQLHQPLHLQRGGRHGAQLTICAGLGTHSSVSYSDKMRASDQFSGSEAEYDEDEDPYMHQGRVNKSAFKRLAKEYAVLTKALMELPRSQLTKIPMPDNVREQVYTLIKTPSHIAKKRQEGLVTKLLRELEDEEVMPIQRAVENIQAGVGVLAVEPAVEMKAMHWREMMVAGDKEIQSEVFALLLEGDVEWSFTRQELGQLVTTARRDKEEAEAARAAEAAEVAETAVMLADGDIVSQNVNMSKVTGKKKRSGGASKAAKTLLKHLREIADVAQRL